MTKSLAITYAKNVVPKRKELFGIDNVMMTPRIEKVVLNARVRRGGSVSEEKIMDTLSRITGQKSVPTKARKSISNFKIREGMVVGVQVTLRGARAFHFLDKLIHVVLPRVRDFSGIEPSSLDGHGNVSLGIREHMVFPETAGDDMSHLHGMQITIHTNARNNIDALALFRALGFPFKKEAGSTQEQEKKRTKKKRS